MPNLIPFHFHETAVHVHVDAQGTPWWDSGDVQNILATYEGIHQEIPHEYFSLLEMLAIASDIQDYHQAMQFLAWLSHCAVALKEDTKSFWQLYGTIVCHLVWEDEHRNAKPDEFYWHAIFIKYLEQLIPGATLAPRRQKKGVGIPDFFVKVENDICPVEIKREVFDESAVRQLRRYIVGFEAPYGFAVARQCTGLLDQNMIYVSLKDLE